MEITCETCKRSFVVDPARAEGHTTAKCLCGSILRLTKEEDGNTRLGQYVLVQRIAVGGMGEIFYGKIAGVEGFEREVAIKKMLPHLSEDQSFINMMINEAKLTVQLHHPNIVQVFDLAKEGNQYYIAMEYVPGITVGHLLERCFRNKIRLPVEVAVHIAMQVLRGLSYAHDLRSPDGARMEVLHRDITPQNIMVTKSAWVKITDFGIAKARTEISTTSPGMIKGKLGYIAPEQLTGDTADQRLDIFCVGIVLWEMLATRRLFKGEDEVDTFRLISQCIVPPLGDYREDVIPEIESALGGSLTATPAQRYKNADAFYDALNQAIFPRTADDYTAAARQFFDKNPEFFVGVAGLKQGEDSGEQKAPPQPRDSIEITEITLRRSKPPSSNKWVLVVIGIAVLMLATAGGLYASGVFSQFAGPDPLSPQEVQLGTDGARSQVLGCCAEEFEPPDRILASMEIAANGAVSKVDLSPTASELGDTGECIATALGGLRFRPNRGPTYRAQVALPNCPSLPVVEDNPGTGKNKKRTKKKRSAVDDSGGGETPADFAKALTSTITKGASGLAKCVDALAEVPDKPSRLVISVTINNKGKVIDASVKPQEKRVEGCLVRQVKMMRFPTQPKPAFTFSFPLDLR
ncbi:MAG: hypothetical protein A2289_22990 [Deltaproteobacteria bacterium RIFOXYA12_FULL_58_15]|nr:MAG: hypothetical protein A2289_22990 [Deltaproteobacteria bacterium RIFOXYA12_FULL_58_15]OGR08869.1 MAG: hypothetical protein A2341_27725 [Deltaproteobacteria bacterium RIFOXYB12_FULL_58_9]